uniref:Uncharacterized protein n=1 Tax=Arundo donax TaxID=35708 RepID=A0A0A9HHN4_ARUDO
MEFSQNSWSNITVTVMELSNKLEPPPSMEETITLSAIRAYLFDHVIFASQCALHFSESISSV